jgi:hypothetical protein
MNHIQRSSLHRAVKPLDLSYQSGNSVRSSTAGHSDIHKKKSKCTF